MRQLHLYPNKLKLSESNSLTVKWLSLSHLTGECPTENIFFKYFKPFCEQLICEWNFDKTRTTNTWNKEQYQQSKTMVCCKLSSHKMNCCGPPLIWTIVRADYRGGSGSPRINDSSKFCLLFSVPFRFVPFRFRSFQSPNDVEHFLDCMTCRLMLCILKCSD